MLVWLRKVLSLYISSPHSYFPFDFMTYLNFGARSITQIFKGVSVCSQSFPKISLALYKNSSAFPKTSSAPDSEKLVL